MLIPPGVCANAWRDRRARRARNRSRIQHPLGPLARAVALVEPALVQAEIGAEPELDLLRLHPQAAPARRPRDIAALELRFEPGQPLFEGGTRIERLRLLRSPCPQLAAARTAGEVGVGFGVGHDFHRPFHAHLDAIAHARPVEQQRGMRIGLQLAALAAIEMGVEDETARIVGLEQDGARRRPRIERGGGDDHGGAVGFARGRRLVKEAVKGGQGFGVEVGSGHPAIVCAGRGAHPGPRGHCTMKVTRRLTRHSATLPASSVTTLISLTHAPWMFFTDSAHFFRPAFTASSMLVFDAALSSMILATDMAVLLDDRRGAGMRWELRRYAAFR